MSLVNGVDLWFDHSPWQLTQTRDSCLKATKYKRHRNPSACRRYLATGEFLGSLAPTGESPSVHRFSSAGATRRGRCFLVPMLHFWFVKAFKLLQKTIFVTYNGFKLNFSTPVCLPTSVTAASFMADMMVCSLYPKKQSCGLN